MGADVTMVIVVVAVLLAATAFGLWRRATDGRLRSVSVPTPVSDDAPPVDLEVGAPEPDFTASVLGTSLGERATLIQFSTAFCQPCRATRRILDEVATMVDGVVHVDIDAESHLDLVRAHGIMRTPTVLIVDGSGAVRQRASGQPRKADVLAAIGRLEGPANGSQEQH